MSKLNAAGNDLVYSTYLGGNYEDAGYGIAVDKTSNAYVTGETFNTDSLYDAFVSKFDSTGTRSYYTTTGGDDDDTGNGIAVDSQGNAYVVGETKSSNFPTTANAFQAKFGGVCDAFVLKLDSMGSLIYSTYLGGSNDDRGYGIAVNNQGHAYITGKTYFSNFPLSQPWQSAKLGETDAFVARLNETGTGLIFSSYIGKGYGDHGYGIALDAKDNAYVTGLTTVMVSDLASTKFVADAFVAKIANNRLSWLFPLGGSDDDWGNGIAVDGAGNVYITGETWSSDFPTKNPFQSSLGGVADAFVAKLKPTPLCSPAIIMLLLQ